MQGGGGALAPALFHIYSKVSFWGVAMGRVRFARLTDFHSLFGNL